MKKLSIIVPIYNKEKYISNFIECLNIQKNKNFEVIFINDGSTDNSLMELKINLKKNEFFFKIFDQKNQGVSVARNKGIEESSCEYISFLDIDDIITEDYTIEIIKKIEENEYEFIWFGIDFYTRKNKEIHLIEKYKENYIYTEEEPIKILENFLNIKIWISICSSVYNKKFLIDKKIKFNKKFSYGEDQDFIIKFLNHTKKIGLIKKSLFYYVKTNDSAMHKFTEKRLEILDVISQNQKYCKEILQSTFQKRLNLELKYLLIEYQKYLIENNCKKIDLFEKLYLDKINGELKNRINLKNRIVLNLLLNKYLFNLYYKYRRSK